MIRLNLGCGNYLKPGWLNCDRVGGTQAWERGDHAAAILELDLTCAPYPFDDASVDLVTMSHCVNQIDPASISPMLAELYRILKPGGVVRITDDDTENPRSPRHGSSHEHARWATGPASAGRLLRAAGFSVHVVGRSETRATDRSILVDNHHLDDDSAFFVEGVKGCQNFAAIGGSVQNRLAAATQYFLHDSIRYGRGRVRRRAERLNARALAELSAALEGFGITLPVRSDIAGVAEYARHLAAAHSAWASVLAGQEDLAVEPVVVERGSTFAVWRARGGDDARYRPAHRLERLMRAKHGETFFARAAIHGSVATLDDVPGFSDLDLAFVIRREVLCAAHRLVALRELASEILALMYTFDPNMHHGPHYLSEIDLAWYPQAFLPLVVLEMGVDVVDSTQLDVGTRDSSELTDQLLDMFAAFFSERAAMPFGVADGYDLEWLLGNAMILPALYLQKKTGAFRYKRDTFAAARADFSAAQWSPIDAATAVRASRVARRSPGTALVALARALRWPGLIPRVMRRREPALARDIVERLGAEFPRDVCRLIDAMRSGLGADRHSDAKLMPPERRRAHFDAVRHGPFTDEPFLAAAADYDNAVDAIVGYWRKQTPAPLSILQIGSVGAPGFSDLDFVVVFPEDAKAPLGAMTPAAFPASVQRLFTHAPYVCTPADWEQLPGWYPAFEMRHLAGERREPPVAPDGTERGCALGMLVDYLMVKVPRDFVWIAWERPLRVRVLVAMLNSLRHTLALADGAGLSVAADRAIVARVDELRSAWFSLALEDRRDALALLCDDGVRVAGNLVSRIDDVLRVAHASAAENVSRRPAAALFRFARDWSIDAALDAADRQYTSTGAATWYNPASFQHVLGVYADASPQLGAYLRDQGCDLSAAPRYDAWDAGLRYHARAMMEYARHAASLGVAPQKYVALGYHRPASPLRKVIRRVRRVLR